MKPEDSRHQRADSIGSYARQALEVTTRARQYPSTHLYCVCQVEKCPGFPPPEAERLQCLLELGKRRRCHDLPRWIPCDDTWESTRYASFRGALEQYLSYGKLIG